MEAVRKTRVVRLEGTGQGIPDWDAGRRAGADAVVVHRARWPPRQVVLREGDTEGIDLDGGKREVEAGGGAGIEATEGEDGAGK